MVHCEYSKAKNVITFLWCKNVLCYVANCFLWFWLQQGISLPNRCGISPIHRRYQLSVVYVIFHCLPSLLEIQPALRLDQWHQSQCRFRLFFCYSTQFVSKLQRLLWHYSLVRDGNRLFMCWFMLIYYLSAVHTLSRCAYWKYHLCNYSHHCLTYDDIC